MPSGGGTVLDLTQTLITLPASGSPDPSPGFSTTFAFLQSADALGAKNGTLLDIDQDVGLSAYDDGSTVSDVDSQLFVFRARSGNYVPNPGSATLAGMPVPGTVNWVGADSVTATYIGQALTNNPLGGSGLEQPFSYVAYENFTSPAQINVFSFTSTAVQGWVTDPFGTVPTAP